MKRIVDGNPDTIPPSKKDRVQQDQIILLSMQNLLFLTLKIQLISWQIDLVRVDLVAIENGQLYFKTSGIQLFIIVCNVTSGVRTLADLEYFSIEVST